MQNKKVLPALVIGTALLLITSCSSSETKPQSVSREVAQHVEGTGEGNVITRVYEERKNGQYAIKIQVIKDGNIKETVHYLENNNFSISVPVSSHIMMQSTEDAGKTSDTNVLVFTQKLELAREAVLQTDYVKALEALNEALRIDSYNPQAHMMKGSTFYAMGKYDLARKEFDYVLSIDPENVEVKRFKAFMDSKDENTRKVKIEKLEE
ncbi:MAG: hypothetical protein GY866_01690 [Proteobacteria bacterium]|nr:hypothetical protein [Pseudomonadota bacterium]